MYDPIQYLNNSGNTKVLDKPIVQEMTSNWGGTSLDIVVDVGCGPGTNSTFWINHFFPDIKRLIGIDMDPRMIDLAKERNAKKSIEFHVADILEKHTLKQWEGGVDKVVSIFTLHRVRDQKMAFENIFALLKPSGDAALHFILDAIYYYAILDLMKIPKWKSLLENTNFAFPESHIQQYDAGYYKIMFEDIGFVVDVCETRSISFAWESDKKCKDFLMSLHNMDSVSPPIKEDFKRDLFEAYQGHTSRNAESRLLYQATVLYVKLHKHTEND